MFLNNLIEHNNLFYNTGYILSDDNDNNRIIPTTKPIEINILKTDEHPTLPIPINIIDEHPTLPIPINIIDDKSSDDNNDDNKNDNNDDNKNDKDVNKDDKDVNKDDKDVNKCGKKDIDDDKCNEKIKLDELLKFKNQINNKYFMALLVICLIGALLLIFNAISNKEIVEIEVLNNDSITLIWYILISVIIAILTAHMVYKPYIIDSYLGKRKVLYALIYYELAYVYWATTLFKSRLNRGMALVAAIILLASTFWLGWVCYHIDNNSIYIFLLLLLYTIYLQNYTILVAHNPWSLS